MADRFTKRQADLILNGSEDDWDRYISRYAKGKRIPHLEPYILKFPHTAYFYAKWVIKGRWPEAEPVIQQDAHAAYWYAIFVIQGRWPEAEPTIAKDPWYACGYARFVIAGRFPEAEPEIYSRSSLARDYDTFLKTIGQERK